jgi:hypothetical protein
MEGLEGVSVFSSFFLFFVLGYVLSRENLELLDFEY